MLDVHKRIHEWRKTDATGRGDPIGPLAAALSYETTLLCFDEFQVTDVADAVILCWIFTNKIMILLFYCRSNSDHHILLSDDSSTTI